MGTTLSKHIGFILVIMVFFLSRIAFGQISSSWTTLATTPVAEFKDAGYKGGLGFGVDLMYSPVSMRSPIQFELGPAFYRSSAGGETRLVDLTDTDEGVDKYRVTNEHLSAEAKARLLIGPQKFKLFGELYTGVRYFDSDLKIKPFNNPGDNGGNEKGHVFGADATYWGYSIGGLYRLTDHIYLTGSMNVTRGQKTSFVDLGQVSSEGDQFFTSVVDSESSDMFMFQAGIYFKIKGSNHYLDRPDRGRVIVEDSGR